MDNEDNIVEGWNVEQTEFMNAASRSTRGQSTEIYMEHDHFEVNTEVGSGYERANANVYIPMEVIVRMMQHAGFTVTRG